MMKSRAEPVRGFSWPRFLVASVSVVWMSIFAAPASVMADNAPTVFITGSSRGIGLELARQYAARGWTVIATCRTPGTAADLQAVASAHDSVVIERLDVLDFARIDELAEQYRGTPIDVLINNAGIGGGAQNQIYGKINYDVFEDVMNVNVKAPLKIAEAFINHVAESDHKKIMTISSSEGSIGMTGGPGRNYFYKPSKTAVNMIMHNLSKAVAGKGVIVGMINPGAVATDFMKGVPMYLMPPEESVIQVIRVIDSYTIETSGRFMNYNGEELAW